MKVYFTIDNNNAIYPCCEWREDIIPESNWYIGEIEGPPYNEYVIPLWKYINGNCIRRTYEEIQNEINNLPKPIPTSDEILRADVDYILMLLGE